MQALIFEEEERVPEASSGRGFRPSWGSSLLRGMSLALLRLTDLRLGAGASLPAGA